MLINRPLNVSTGLQASLGAVRKKWYRVSFCLGHSVLSFCPLFHIGSLWGELLFSLESSFLHAFLTANW